MRPATIFIAGMMALAGCADALDTVPFFVVEPGAPRVLASCAYRELLPTMPDVRLTYLDDTGGAELIEQLDVCGLAGCFDPRRILAIEFSKRDDISSILEIRDHPTLMGNHYYWRTQIEPVINACSTKSAMGHSDGAQ
jgi:hypothetical protein